MEQKINRLFNAFTINNNITTTSQQQSDYPQIGFKVSFCENGNFLKIKVIGARKLPGVYGNSKPKGYLVKVTLFPEKEKFETKTAIESWPTFNEEFSFKLGDEKVQNVSLKGKFISFTVYAHMDDEEKVEAKKPRQLLKRFFSFDDSHGDVTLRKNSKLSRRSFRHSLINRRTIGAVTYNLDPSIFTQKLRAGEISTPDIWRSIKEITSGVVTQPRDGPKGCVEVTLCYALSEDGRNDVVEVSVTKLRCSVQTMQQHEKVGGQLYIKITAFEREDLVQKMKSDKFEPTISLKLEANTATLRANVNQYNLDYVKILIRLLSKNILGKKELLGTIEINRYSDVWKEIVSSPSVPITRMMNFE